MSPLLGASAVLVLFAAAAAAAEAPARTSPPAERPADVASPPPASGSPSLARPAGAAPAPPARPATAEDAATEPRPGSGRAVSFAPRPVTRPNRTADRSAAASGPITRAATLIDAMPLDETVLIGVIGRDDERFALLRTPAGEMRRVEEGEVVEGWTIVEIADDAVRMRAGDGRARTLAFP